MAKKRLARQLLVSNVAQLTPNMRRITLQGQELANLPEDAEGGYFKLNFPGQDPNKPTLRTYTVSRYRRELQEIDVDFMLHAHSDGLGSGVAATWATQAQIGATMAIFGPAPATYIGQAAIWSACEFKTMKKIRQYFREVRNVDKSHMYISSYWKKGLQEEEHKIEKSKDAA